MAHIRYTNDADFNGNKHKKFPVILSGDLSVHRLSLKYFLSLRVQSSSATLVTYAQHLCDFLSQLEYDNKGLSEGEQLSWDEVNDQWLENYCNELRSRLGTDKDNSSNYVGHVLRTVIAFLDWAQKSNYARNLTGYGEFSRIRLLPAKSEGAISHPLVKRFTREKSPSRTAPLKEWIETVKEHTTLAGAEQYKRFELMVDWGVGVGLRAHEICALNIEQLPSRKTVENAAINGKNVFISLHVTKGSKPKTVPLSPLLVKRTWDYIEGERLIIVNKFKSKAKKNKVPFSESSEVFLSATTGRALNARSFSNQVRNAWLNAVNCGELTEDELVWAHGLRHRFATDLLKGLDSAGVKRPEEIAKHLSRHSKSESLEAYTVGRYFEDDNG